MIRLDGMTPDDAPGLLAALDDPRVWEKGYGGGPAGRPRDDHAMRLWVERSLAGAGSTGRGLSGTVTGCAVMAGCCC